MGGMDDSQVRALANKIGAASAETAAAAQPVVSAIAKAVKVKAQGLAPLGPTGDLRRSITYRVRGLSATVSAGVPYARFVEYGTARMSPQPFMAPAADGQQERFAALLAAAAAKALP